MSPTTVTPMSISQLTPMISGGFPVTVTEAGSICWCELKMACCNPPLQTVFSGQRDGTCQHREGAVFVRELPVEGFQAAKSQPDRGCSHPLTAPPLDTWIWFKYQLCPIFLCSLCSLGLSSNPSGRALGEKPLGPKPSTFSKLPLRPAGGIHTP